MFVGEAEAYPVVDTWVGSGLSLATEPNAIKIYIRNLQLFAIS
jgi:hypothetical protein